MTGPCVSSSACQYFLFGFGYIGYMTFVVASMVAKGASQLDVALTWGTLGVATMLAPLAWRAPRSRWYASKMLAAIGIVLSIGAAIPLYSTSRAAMIVSAFLFGIAMFSVPASVTDMVKTSLPKPAWSPAVAFFTVLFAAGQFMGPLFTGWLADATQSLNWGLAGIDVRAARCERGGDVPAGTDCVLAASTGRRWIGNSPASGVGASPEMKPLQLMKQEWACWEVCVPRRRPTVRLNKTSTSSRPGPEVPSYRPNRWRLEIGS